ncbi:SUKH-4 family immunity protein [Cryptosporangium arvum]|uniref:SUKH-4 immunity protein n=1 Tax=Cryptosporangium arvum DSM 44712 TaxID=927661 RepID=A0A011AEM8_9ACTN|nr:SUKH-4 family immunity protein [Cryptosporangium arvum]EXG80491.1 hypothetical protein CryarDRAFT_1567 [Cryptosporangium arvum DSM 44712]
MTNKTEPGWSDQVVAHVRRFWDGRLRAIDPARIHPDLSAVTRRYLSDVGLPDFAPRWGFECIADRTDQILTRDGRDYVVVGGIRGTSLLYGIDVRTDQVFCVNSQDPMDEPELMNTTVALWVLSAGAVDREIISQIGVVEPDSAEAGAVVERVRQFLTAMDPVAMRYERGRTWHGYLNSFED